MVRVTRCCHALFRPARVRTGQLLAPTILRQPEAPPTSGVTLAHALRGIQNCVRWAGDWTATAARVPVKDKVFLALFGGGASTSARAFVESVSFWARHRARGTFTLTRVVAEDFRVSTFFHPGTLTLAGVSVEVLRRNAVLLFLACARTCVAVKLFIGGALGVRFALALACVWIENLSLLAVFVGCTLAFARPFVECLLFGACRFGMALTAAANWVEDLVLGALLVAEPTPARTEMFVEPLITGASWRRILWTFTPASVRVEHLREVRTCCACVWALALASVSIQTFWWCTRHIWTATLTRYWIQDLVGFTAASLACTLAGGRIEYLWIVALLLSGGALTLACVYVELLFSWTRSNGRAAALAVLVVVYLLWRAGLFVWTLALTRGSVVDLRQCTLTLAGTNRTLTPALCCIEPLVSRTGVLRVWTDTLTEVRVEYLPWRTLLDRQGTLALTCVRIELLCRTALLDRCRAFALALLLVVPLIGGAEGDLGAAALAGLLIKHSRRGASPRGARGAATLAENRVEILCSGALRERGTATGTTPPIENLVPRTRCHTRAPTLTESLVKYLVLCAPFRVGGTLALAGGRVKGLCCGALLVHTLTLTGVWIQHFVSWTVVV